MLFVKFSNLFDGNYGLPSIQYLPEYKMRMLSNSSSKEWWGITL